MGIAAAAILCGTTAAQTSRAANIILTNGNSSVTINPTSSAGLENWSINGQNQINQEWFWFRVGGTGGQSSLDTLGSPKISLLDTTGDGKDDTAMLTYGSSSGIQVTVTYSLTGGSNSSSTSDLGETIRINNNGSSSVNYHLFDYANFNLGGSTTGQTVSITGANTATDTGNGYSVQTVASPVASEYAAGLHPTLLDEINSSSPATLSDSTSTSSGDGEFAFEWDPTIKMCSSFTMSVDQRFQGTIVQAVPEPIAAPIALMGLGGMAMTRRRRRPATRA
jgi:hypothetical protein